jgi:hypothetical protein
MFVLGFFAIFAAALASTLSLKRNALVGDIRNLSTSMFGFSALFFAGILWWISAQFDLTFSSLDDWAHLRDPRFSLTVFLETLGVWVARSNYTKNGNNVTAINFAMFLSIILVPLIAFFANEPLGFTDTPRLQFSSTTTFLLTLLAFSALICIYFLDKFKGKQYIRHWPLLILAPLLLSCTMFLTGKLIQTYNPFAVAASMGLVIWLVFLAAALWRREFALLQRHHTKQLLILFVIIGLYCLSNMAATKLLAIELLALFKRTGQVLAATFIDRLYNKGHFLNAKDKGVVTCMLLFGVLLYGLQQG